METNQQKLIERAVKLILGNRYLTMATRGSPDSDPWIAPLAYVTDAEANFYFYSAIWSKHISHLQIHNVVACAIFDSTKLSDDVDGMQFSATVEEVEDSLLAHVMKLYFVESFPDPIVRARWERPLANFQGTAPQRFFRMTPTAIHLIDLEATEVDQRVEINLTALRSAFSGEKQSLNRR